MGRTETRVTTGRSRRLDHLVRFRWEPTLLNIYTWYWSVVCGVPQRGRSHLTTKSRTKRDPQSRGSHVTWEPSPGRRRARRSVQIQKAGRLDDLSDWTCGAGPAGLHLRDCTCTAKTSRAIAAGDRIWAIPEPGVNDRRPTLGPWVSSGLTREDAARGSGISVSTKMEMKRERPLKTGLPPPWRAFLTMRQLTDSLPTSSVFSPFLVDDSISLQCSLAEQDNPKIEPSSVPVTRRPRNGCVNNYDLQP